MILHLLLRDRDIIQGHGWDSPWSAMKEILVTVASHAAHMNLYKCLHLVVSMQSFAPHGSVPSFSFIPCYILLRSSANSSFNSATFLPQVIAFGRSTNFFANFTSVTTTITTKFS
jgi:hypothetical protein